MYIALAAARPTTGFNGAALGTADTGLLFLASDTGIFQYWSGTTWVPIGVPVNTVVNFTPVIEIGGSTTGISFTTTQATSTLTGSGTGAVATIFISVTITAWPAAPVGNVTILGFPVTPIRAFSPATFVARSGFVGLTGPVIAVVNILPNLLLNIMTATGISALPPTAITSTSIFTVGATYLSA
jgi:hypothetical protein